MRNEPHTEFDRIVRTVCSPNCTGNCGVNAFVKNDRIVKLEPASFPDPKFERICLRGIAMATQRIHHPDRLTHPLIRTGERGEGKWRQVSWDEAYDYICERLERIAAEDGWRANSWVTQSGNFGTRAITAPARVSNSLQATHFSYAGLSADVAAIVGWKPILGEYFSSQQLCDVVGAKYLLSVGKALAETAHSEMHFLFDAMEQGLKFVMIDPRFSRTAAKADEWVSPRPGTDAALALGMIHTVVTEGRMNTEYVLKNTNSAFLVDDSTGKLLRARDLSCDGPETFLVWDIACGRPVAPDEATQPALRGSWQVTTTDGRSIACRTAFEANWMVWKEYTPEHAATICEVPAEQIRSVAREYATADPAWLWLGYGPNRYDHGHIYVRAFVTLAALCGNIGKPYAGVNLTEGALGAFYFGVPDSYLKPGGRECHSLPGTQLVEIIASGQPYRVRSLWITNYGFATQSSLFKRFVAEALPKLDLYIVTEQVMTRAAEYADIVLPCVSYYEDDWDLVPSVETWHMQLRRRAVPPVGDSRSDFDIFGGLCDRLGRGADWWIDPEEACRRILAEHQDTRISTIDWETLRRDGVADVSVASPHTPHLDMKFNTPTGRIEFYQEDFLDLHEAVLDFKRPNWDSGRARGFPLMLLTYKHVHSTHSQHTILPLIREMIPEPLLEIAPEDAAARGIVDGAAVEVFNDRGSFKVKATVSYAGRPGLVCLPQGFWHRHFLEGHPSDLGHIPANAMQDRIYERNYACWDIACEVRKV